ncbi:MAG: hypothetical protein OXD46_15420 [Chloroflexi bacterium]|nr:hypothetical protein [Chloroflexota bacterium]
MADRGHKPGDIAARGEAIYRERIRPLVKSVAKGSFVVIDIESGDYEVGAGDASATRRLLDRRPGAVTYGVRVGHRAAYSHVGGFRTPVTDD